MTTAQDWQDRVGRTWADEWRRTDRSFADLTHRLLDRVADVPGNAVLDLGCGAGELALAIAAARPAARVAGVDISADLIAVAAARAGGLARFHCADAGLFVDPAGPADVLVSRHGVMFYADPPAVFAHLADHAAPDARMVFSCFRAAAENPWATLFAPLFGPAAPPPVAAFPAGPFAFADPAHVARAMAGWTDLAFEPVDFAYCAGEGVDPVADAVDFFSRIGPAAARLAALDPAARADARAQMAVMLAPFANGGRVVLPAAAWIVTARKRTP